MWKCVASGIGVSAALLLWALPASAGEGKEAFLLLHCNVCHSVASDGIAKPGGSRRSAPDDPFGEEETPAGPPDLSGVGQRHEGEWIAAFLRKEADIGGKKHPPSFTGTEADLASLVEYLAALTDTSGGAPSGAD